MTAPIVLLRGTSGAGKTYVAQQVLKQLGPYTSTYTLGPKDKLAGYAWPSVALLGRYETACGGCDALSWKGASDEIEALALRCAAGGRAVLLEGLIVSNWGDARVQRFGPSFVILHLTTPLEVCLDAINARRRARADAKGTPYAPVDTDNTTRKHASLLSSSERQARLGVRVEYVDRPAALVRTRELLGL